MPYKYSKRTRNLLGRCFIIIIILLAFVRYEMIIANSALFASLATQRALVKYLLNRNDERAN